MTFKLCYTLRIFSRDQRRRRPQIPSWWSPVHPELSLLPWFVGERMCLRESLAVRWGEAFRGTRRETALWQDWRLLGAVEQTCVLLLKLCEGGLWVQIKCKTARSRQRPRFIRAVLLNRWLVTQKKGFTVNDWVQTTNLCNTSLKGFMCNSSLKVLYVMHYIFSEIEPKCKIKMHYNIWRFACLVF